jgi:hypothetical protein
MLTKFCPSLFSPQFVVLHSVVLGSSCLPPRHAITAWHPSSPTLNLHPIYSERLGSSCLSIASKHIEKMVDSRGDRLAACWRIQNCYNCIHSKHGCGWCPQSSTCVPASLLLEPVSNARVCPIRDERFELRTKALGCGCSTITLLSVIVTVFATIVGLLLLYGFAILVYKFNHNFGTGTWRGIEVEVKNDGTRFERQWERTERGKNLSFLHRIGFWSNKSEQEQVTERTRLLR